MNVCRWKGTHPFDRRRRCARRRLRLSRRATLKDRRTHVADRRMSPALIVEDLEVVEQPQALAISEDCADSWVTLAEEASTPDAAVERYERALLAGAAAFGVDRFASLRGEFRGASRDAPLHARSARAGGCI